MISGWGGNMIMDANISMYFQIERTLTLPLLKLSRFLSLGSGEGQQAVSSNALDHWAIRAGPPSVGVQTWGACASTLQHIVRLITRVQSVCL